MNRTNKWLHVLLCVFLCLPLVALAQKKPVKKTTAPKKSVEKPVAKKPNTAEDEKKIRDIVSFLEYMLNTLGNSSTPVRDKDVLVTESYAKIFRDSKVQIEDDLDEDRKVITNKNITAYLKDVNFFFHNVRFEFTIDNIASKLLPNGQTFYKVTTTRSLKGTTSENKPVQNTSPRYIEINYDPQGQDLKIVSIYTKEFNEKEALINWWKELSYEWQSIFKKKMNLKDSVQLSDIKRISSIDALDISSNPYVQTLDPLSQLLSLRALNLSHTKTTSLAPIRNLTELTDLDLSETAIQDISSLKYLFNLERLNISGTRVTNVDVLSQHKNMQELLMNDVAVDDFAPLAGLTQVQVLKLSRTRAAELTWAENLTRVEELSISGTLVKDLGPLQAMENLKWLDADSTRITSLKPLSDLVNLKEVQINYTSVSELQPLQNKKQLTKIYCDHTPIKSAAAKTFMTANPHTLVIVDSEDLRSWWNGLSQPWQKVLAKACRITNTPTKEELATLPLLDSINLQGSDIITLQPLRLLTTLKKVSARGTNVSDLAPLKGIKTLQYLDIGETTVADISIVNGLTNLEVLKIDRTKVDNLDLIQSPSLKKVYADQTGLDDGKAAYFLTGNAHCLLIYKSERLQVWWNNLPEIWKKALLGDRKASKENLHALIEESSLTIKDVLITDLTPLAEYIRLRELYLSGTAIAWLTPVDNIRFLKILHVTNSPLQSTENLTLLTDLEELDLSNTPIEDVYEVWRLKKLKKLNCAGTQIKRLDVLEKLESLEYLDCSNTNVSKLTPLDYIPLKTLKCYNTRVSVRSIENFKASHPECTVVYY